MPTPIVAFAEPFAAVPATTMTDAETILPEFPDTEQIRELRFHVRSLQQDLAASVTRLEACLPLASMEPATIWRLREAVADTTATIEHDARHHVQRALELVSAISSRDNHMLIEVEPAVAAPLTTSAGPGPRRTRCWPGAIASVAGSARAGWGGDGGARRAGGEIMEHLLHGPSNGLPDILRRTGP